MCLQAFSDALGGIDFDKEGNFRTNYNNAVYSN
jgi:hypothetical protein